MAALRPSPWTGRRPDCTTAAIGNPWKRQCIRDPAPTTEQRPDWSTAAINGVGDRPWKRRRICYPTSSTPKERTIDEMASMGMEYYMPHGLILADSVDTLLINPPVQEFLFSTRSHTEAFWETYSDSEFEFQNDTDGYSGSEAITLVADDCRS